MPQKEIQEQIVFEIEEYSPKIKSLQSELLKEKEQIEELFMQFDRRNLTKIALGKLAHNITNKVNPQSMTGETKYIGLENIAPNEGTLCGEIDSEVLSIRSAKTVFSKNDVLYGKLRPYLNKVYFADFDGICSTDIIVLRFDTSESAKVFSYYMRRKEFVDIAMESKSGQQLPRTSWEKIKTILVPQYDEANINSLMSAIRLFEQKRDTITSSINELLSMQENVIHKHL